MSSLAGNSAFRRYWWARLTSYAGDQVARTALLIAVYDRHGGSAVAMLLLASTAPRLLGPVLGALADRFDQRRLIVVCDTSQAGLYLAVALLAPPLPILLALITAASVAATTFTPAGRSLLPELVGRDNLPAANARLAVGVNVGFAAGPAVGGLLLATTGLTTTLLIDAATFVVSAMLIGGAHRLARTPAVRTAEPFRHVLRDGLRVVRRHGVVRAVSLGFFVMVAFAALDNVAIVPLGRADLAVDAFLVGLLTTAYGIGMVLGPMSLSRAGDQNRMDLVLYAALLALGLGTVLTGLRPLIAVAIAGQAIAGIGAGWHNVAADTLIQQSVPADRLGTVFGTVYMFPYAAEVVAYAAGAWLLSSFGPRWVLVVSGLGVLATLGLIAPMLARALRPQPHTRPVAAVVPAGG